MKPALPINAIRFTTQGRIVIPAQLRKKYNIKAGTKVVIETTPVGILIKPVNRQSIVRFRGISKRFAVRLSFAERRAQHKSEEIELEDRKRIIRSGENL